jgi:hypothetical protein
MSLSSSPIRHRLLLACARLAAVAAGTAVAQTAKRADPALSVQTTPQVVPPAPSMQPGQGAPGPHGGRGGHHDHANRGERMFMQLDTDRDGKLSRGEFEAGQKAMMERAQRAFDTADADRDGSLSATERQAFRQAMHAQMHAEAGAQEGSHRRRGGSPAPAATPVQPGS